MPLNLTAFPVIETKRLKLQKVKKKDASEIFFLRTDVTHNKFISRPIPKSILEAAAFIDGVNEGFSQGQNIYWGISLKPSAKIIGTISLWHFTTDMKTVEIGYDLHKDYRSQGIMSEALKTVINYGFNVLCFKQIEAFTHFENEASIALLQKNGFVLLPERRDEGNTNNSIYFKQCL